MTTKQLYKEVLAMGFDRLRSEGEADADTVFSAAVNRAQETLSAVLPLVSTLTLPYGGIGAGLEREARTVGASTPALFLPSLSLSAGERKTVTGKDVLACTFSAVGEGKIEFRSGSLLLAEQSFSNHLQNADFSLVFDRPDECTATVCAGTGGCTVTDFSFLRNVEEGVRRRASSTEYDLSRLIPGGLSLAAPPARTDGRILTEGRDYRIRGSVLTILLSTPCQLTLSIVRLPRYFDLSCDLPDVRAEAMGVLPLLTAAYVWLDRDREKSLFYLSMYRESLARLSSNGRGEGTAVYGHGNGW